MNVEKCPGGFVSRRRIALFRKKLLAWFRVDGRLFPWRKREVNSFVLLVVEVLLQRTRAETIAVFLPRFLDRYPGWREIASSSLDDLEESLRPIGLWRRRARSMQGLARELVALGERWPKQREGLEQLPAVGQYVANAVQLFVHHQSHPLMDASMARLLRRYFVILPEKADIRFDQALHTVAYRVLANGLAIELNWAMLDIAATYCKPRQPICPDCPLRRSCAHARSASGRSGQRNAHLPTA